MPLFTLNLLSIKLLELATTTLRYAKAPRGSTTSNDPTPSLYLGDELVPAVRVFGHPGCAGRLARTSVPTLEGRLRGVLPLDGGAALASVLHPQAPEEM